MSKKPELDEETGVHTTGHAWDGIKELNNPLPRWWVWVWLVTIIWSFGYMIVYPSWPMVTSYVKGTGDFSQRRIVMQEMAEIKAARAPMIKKLLAADLKTIQDTPELLEFSMAAGKAAFGDNCAACHGMGATGAKGYPDLNDDDWLWGGTLEQIHETITVGIRSIHDDTRVNDMPAFLDDELLSKQEISNVVDFVISLSNSKITAPKGAATIFTDNCASCHGSDAKGIIDLGAPNLTDVKWLYGGDRETLIHTVSHSRKGVMPTWDGRLSPATIKGLAVYVHTLGGGQSSPMIDDKE